MCYILNVCFVRLWVLSSSGCQTTNKLFSSFQDLLWYIPDYYLSPLFLISCNVNCIFSTCLFCILNVCLYNCMYTICTFVYMYVSVSVGFFMSMCVWLLVCIHHSPEKDAVVHLREKCLSCCLTDSMWSFAVTLSPKRGMCLTWWWLMQI